MNTADEVPVKIEAPESTSAPDNLGQNFDEPAADAERPSEQRRPVEELHNLLLRISHHLDFETSERSTIYYRLLAIDAQAKRIENQTKRRGLRGLFRFLVAILLGVAGTLAWQSYGEATKQVIATRAPELGWSPQSKEMIAGWIQQIGWTKPEGAAATAASPVAETPRPIAAAQTPPETVEAKPPAAPAVDPEQVQQIIRSLTVLQQTVEQLATSQDQMARQITSLQTADSDVLKRLAPSPQPAAPPLRKPIPAPIPRTPAPAR